MKKYINKSVKSPNSTIYSERDKNTFLTESIYSNKRHGSKFHELKQSEISNSSMPNAINTIDK
jgi:hypothetical protein